MLDECKGPCLCGPKYFYAFATHKEATLAAVGGVLRRITSRLRTKSYCVMVAIAGMEYPTLGLSVSGVDHLSGDCSKRRFARSSGVGFNSPVTPMEKLCS